jgi:hypothetical protein
MEIFCRKQICRKRALVYISRFIFFFNSIFAIAEPMANPVIAGWSGFVIHNLD